MSMIWSHVTWYIIVYIVLSLMRILECKVLISLMANLLNLTVRIWFDCYKYFDDIIEFKNQSWPTFHRINLAIRSQVNKLNSAWIFPFIMYVYSRPLTVPNLCGFYLNTACFIVPTTLLHYIIFYWPVVVWQLQYWQSAEILELLLKSAQQGDNLTMCLE